MNKFIYFLLYFSLLFAIGVILFHLGIIPPIFGYSDKYKEINEVLLNLSYSYLAGYIFYIFIEVLPNLSKNKKALLFFGPSLTSIYSLMAQIVAISKLEGGIKKNNDDILLEDCSFANNVEIKAERVAVLNHVRINGKDSKGQPILEWYDKITTQSEYAELIKNKIDSMQKREIYSNLSESLKNLIDQVYSSDYLFDLISVSKSLDPSKPIMVSRFNGDKHFYAFIQILKKLKSFDFDIHEHTIEKMPKTEAATYLTEVTQFQNTYIFNKDNEHKRIYKGNKRMF